MIHCCRTRNLPRGIYIHETKRQSGDGGATIVGIKEICSTMAATKGTADIYNDVSSWLVKRAVTGYLRRGGI